MLPDDASRRSGLGQAWTLFFGIGLLMLGNGLQGSLLGLRASEEGFGNGLIGIVMANFFLGFLVGSIWATHAIRRVGHIRVFAALAALASTAILVQSVFVDPLTWGLMRLVTGFAYAGIFVVAESWLNAKSTNETRGQMLSYYMITTFAGMGGGQLMLNVADPAGTDLFILVSALISMSVLPLLLSAAPAPIPEGASHVGFGRLYRASPLGVTGMFAAGLINGTVFGMGAVYAREIGLSVADISLFMGALIVGGASLQWPIGKLSDLVDRRLVITLVTFSAAGVALAANLAATLALPWLLATAALFGGVSLSLHSLSLAYTNDYLEPTEMVGASGGLVIVLGAGSIVGPSIVGLAIGFVGPASFFWWLTLVHVAVGGFALWRMTRRAPIPNEDQGPYVALPTAISQVAMSTAEDMHAEQVQP